MSSITVVPGWGEGKRQMREAVQGLNLAGIKTSYSRSVARNKPYDTIVAHSGGTYQYWSHIQATHLILVAPPWHTLGRFTTAELSRRVKSRRRDRVSKPSVYESLRFLASIRSTLRHSRAVREIDLLGELTGWLEQDKKRHIDLVIYRNDVWTDPEIQHDFTVLPRLSMTVLDGHHDDLHRRPRELIRLIAKKLT